MPVTTQIPASGVHQCCIPFEDDQYSFSKTYLEKQISHLTDFHEYDLGHLKFLSFQNGVLTLLKNGKADTHTVTLQVKDNLLQLSCTCCHKKQNLCMELAETLYKILYYVDEHYLTRLQPDGLFELAKNNPTFFDKKESLSGIDIIPRPELNCIYKLHEYFNLAQSLSGLLQLPSSPSVSDNGEVFVYMFVQPIRKRGLPFVVPTRGRLNKNGIGIRTFNMYLDGLQEEYKPLYSETQDTLNTACLNLWKETKKMPEDISLNLSKHDSLPEVQLIFKLWQQLKPYLLVQPHIYWTKYYRERYLKMKPFKNRCYYCTIAPETPTFRFILKDMGTNFRLYLEAIVNDKTIAEFDADPYFFITHQTTFYLLASLRDVAITHWIEKSGGYITIFKPHFAAFEKEILDPLRQHYPVLIKSRTKKITTGK